MVTSEAATHAAQLTAQHSIDKEVALKGGEAERTRLRETIHRLESEARVLETELARRGEQSDREAEAKQRLREELATTTEAKLAAEAREAQCHEATHKMASELVSAHRVIKELGVRLDETKEWKAKIEAEARSWREKLASQPPAIPLKEESQTTDAPMEGAAVELEADTVFGVRRRSPNAEESAKEEMMPENAAHEPPMATIEASQEMTQTQSEPNWMWGLLTLIVCILLSTAYAYRDTWLELVRLVAASWYWEPAGGTVPP